MKYVTIPYSNDVIQALINFVPKFLIRQYCTKMAIFKQCHGNQIQ